MIKALNEKTQEELEVNFNHSNPGVFDLKTIGVQEDFKGKTLYDSFHKIFSQAGNRDFTYIEKAISVGDEILVGGSLEFNKKFYLRNPTIIIGSDMNELKSFVGGKGEMCYLNAGNLMKLCIGLTAAHFVLFQVPKLFEKYFEEEPK